MTISGDVGNVAVAVANNIPVQRDTTNSWHLEQRWADKTAGLSAPATGADIVADAPFKLHYFYGGKAGSLVGVPIKGKIGQFRVVWNCPGRGSGSAILKEKHPGLYVGTSRAIRGDSTSVMVTTIARSAIVAVSSPTDRAFGAVFSSFGDFAKFLGLIIILAIVLGFVVRQFR